MYAGGHPLTRSEISGQGRVCWVMANYLLSYNDCISTERTKRNHLQREPEELIDLSNFCEFESSGGCALAPSTSFSRRRGGQDPTHSTLSNKPALSHTTQVSPEDCEGQPGLEVIKGLPPLKSYGYDRGP